MTDSEEYDFGKIAAQLEELKKLPIVKEVLGDCKGFIASIRPPAYYEEKQAGVIWSADVYIGRVNISLYEYARGDDTEIESMVMLCDKYGAGLLRFNGYGIRVEENGIYIQSKQFGETKSLREQYIDINILNRYARKTIES